MTTYPDTLEEISKYIFTSKYARYLPDLKRRETWEEAVGRVEDMHLRKFEDSLLPEDISEIRRAFDLVREKRVVPSMRSMQFGGLPIESKNERQYNCAVRHVDSIRAFSESFFLLLCGCGVGFGLTDRYLDRLPRLVGPEDRTGIVQTYVIEDTVEGWADSIEALLNCYFVNTAYAGRKIVFDYSRIRPAGSPLKTSGGKAPGHEGLKAAHRKVKALLDSIIEDKGQDRLKTIDAYDILMHCADAVLSGGVRRSACSVMFDKDDVDMLMAKTGSWYTDNPQRGRSNNSVVLVRGQVSREEFDAVVGRTREWGEPGFVFVDDPDMLYNPCFEIGMMPVTEGGVCGVTFCNLTSINGSLADTVDKFKEAAWAASLIGTLQASYTDFPYLSHEAEELTERESLLGVSITAMMDNPDVLLDPDIQREAAQVAVDTNQEWAQRIGINPAARVTAIKPEGTSTLALGSMSSGIHPSHAHRMFRRVQANKLDNVYQFFKSYNPHMCEPSEWSANATDDVITFPIQLPEKTMVKKDLTALEHLDIIRKTQEAWVNSGSTEYNKFNVSHNVSCTIVVQEDEWDDVITYLHGHQEVFAAVSLLASSGDKDYAQAPMEAVTTEKDNERFEQMMKNIIPLDYTAMIESTDDTSLSQEVACGGAMGCDVITS